MSDLSIGWAVVRVGDVVALNPKNDAQDQTEAGFSPMQLLGTEFRSSVGFEPRPWGEIKKSYTHFGNGDVLLAKITPCFENGKAGLVAGMPNKIGAGSSEYFVCRPEPAVLEAKYLLAHFKTDSFLRRGAVEMTGSVGHKRVPKDYLLNSQLPLAPIKEQKRIADKIDAVLARLEACRERLDRLPGILKRFRRSVLSYAASGQLTVEWRGASSGSSEGSLPATWVDCQIKDVGRIQLGRQRSPKFHAGKAMRPYLRVQNVFEDRLELSDVMQMDFPGGDFERYQLHPGDILLNEGQSPEYLGRPAMYRGELPGACFTNTLIRFQAETSVNPEFALLIFRHHMHSGRYRSEGNTTTNIAHLGAGRFSNVEFPLPPIDEQAEIVRRVESLFSWADRLEARHAAAHAQVARLTPSLLAKAFRGELVPQDPADEPASELLKRLTRQAAANPSVPAKRKGSQQHRAKPSQTASNVREEC